MSYRPTIEGTDNPAVRRGTTAKNNGRYNGNGREWETPPEVFGPLNDEFHFTLDPCATASNHKCATFFTEADDGLAQSWAGEKVFMNPPYGREVYAWTRKAREESQVKGSGTVVVGLLPASTDLAWWHEDVVAVGAEVRYIRGRVRFLTGGPYRASGFFASVVVVWHEPRYVDRTGWRGPRYHHYEPSWVRGMVDDIEACARCSYNRERPWHLPDETSGALSGRSDSRGRP